MIFNIICPLTPAATEDYSRSTRSLSVFVYDNVLGPYLSETGNYFLEEAGRLPRDIRALGHKICQGDKNALRAGTCRRRAL